MTRQSLHTYIHKLTLTFLITFASLSTCVFITQPSYAQGTVTFDVDGRANLYQQTDPGPLLPNSIDPVRVPQVCLRSDQEVTITATGCVVDAGLLCSGPDGPPGFAGILFRDLQVFSLIGRWSSSPDVLDNSTVVSAPFFVGSNALLTAPSSPGEYYLFLGENDGDFIDNSGAYTVTATWTHTCVTTPRAIKEDAIAELEALRGVVDPGLLGLLDKAIQKIDDSLIPALWDGESRVIDRDVFGSEIKACRMIYRMIRDTTDTDTIASLEEIKGMLFEADEILAQIAIDDGSGDIPRAEAAFSDAQAAAADGDCAAIKLFMRAWRDALGL